MSIRKGRERVPGAGAAREGQYRSRRRKRKKNTQKTPKVNKMNHLLHASEEHLKLRKREASVGLKHTLALGHCIDRVQRLTNVDVPLLDGGSLRVLGAAAVLPAVMFFVGIVSKHFWVILGCFYQFGEDGIDTGEVVFLLDGFESIKGITA